jgi:hypothetical protein
VSDALRVRFVADAVHHHVGIGKGLPVVSNFYQEGRGLRQPDGAEQEKQNTEDGAHR